MKVIVLVVSAIAFSSTAFAAPLGVREINIGMPKEQVIEILKTSAKTGPESRPDRLLLMGGWP